MSVRALFPTLVVLLAGCADAGPALDAIERDVAEHRALWEADRPQAYVYEVERQCFCGEAARGPVRVRVEGNTVVSRVYVDSGEPVGSELAEFFPPVDGLFDILADAIDRDAYDIDVTWAAEGGLPLDAFIDYSENIADEELGFRIEALPEAVTGG